MTSPLHLTDTDEENNLVDVYCHYSIKDEENEIGKYSYWVVIGVIYGNNELIQFDDFEAENPDIAKEIESMLEDALDEYGWHEDTERDD